MRIKRTSAIHVVVILSVLLSLASPLRADVGVGTNLFSKGRTRVSATVGTGTAFNDTYTILGLGAGYFLTNGLEAGLDGQAWLGSGPSIYKLSPQLTYVVYQLERIKPYVGGFYRRTFYSGYEDQDSAGARFGVYIPMNPNVYLGGGGVYEKYINCNSATYVDCSSWYPEITASFAF
jgi:hypothetical protein